MLPWELKLSRLLTELSQDRQTSRRGITNVNEQAIARKLLITAQNKLATAQHNLATEQAIAQDIAPLVEQGAVSNLQYRRQQEAGNSQIEVETQQAEATSLLGEIESLNHERGRLHNAIAQSQANLTKLDSLEKAK